MLTEVHLERVDGQYTLQASNDAFLDDWFHRGSALGWMCHYVYAMYVKVVPRTEEFQCDRVIPFVSHYKKHTGFVQVLEASPRVPYMVGFTMPSRHGDAATNALYHLCLMKPGSMCRGQCDDVGWLSGHVISHCWPRHQRNMFGFTWPTRKSSPQERRKAIHRSLESLGSIAVDKGPARVAEVESRTPSSSVRRCCIFSKLVFAKCCKRNCGPIMVAPMVAWAFSACLQRTVERKAGKHASESKIFPRAISSAASTWFGLFACIAAFGGSDCASFCWRCEDGRRTSSNHSR